MNLTNFYSHVPTAINGRLPAMELLLVASRLVSWWSEGGGVVTQAGVLSLAGTVLGKPYLDLFFVKKHGPETVSNRVRQPLMNCPWNCFRVSGC